MEQEGEETPLLALLSCADVFQHVLRHLDARAFGALCQTCHAMRDWLAGPGEELLRTLCYAECGGKSRVRLRLGQTYAGLFFSPRLKTVLCLSSFGGECVALAKRDVVCRTLCAGDALTTSPNGKLGCFVSSNELVVFDVASGRRVGQCATGGSVVYCYFDTSSTILTWIFFINPDLRLGWFDLATMTRSDSGDLRGSPFFWHLSPWDPAVALVHTDNRIVLLNLIEPSRPKVLFEQDDSNALFQVPHLVLGGKSCLVGAACEDALLLLLIAAEERSKAESARVVEDVVANPTSPHLLHRFPASGMLLMQSTCDDCVIAGTLDEVFIQGICDIDLRTRARVVIDVPNALAFFVSPSGRFVLFLCFHLEHGKMHWSIYDRRTHARTTLEIPIAKTKLLLVNRRPFQSAYALSHSPWDKRPGSSSFCFVTEDGLSMECEVIPVGRQIELVPTAIPGMAQDNRVPLLVWFS